MNDIIEYKIAEHDNRLDEHEKRLDKQREDINTQDKAIMMLTNSIDNLAKQLAQGFSVVKWLGGIFLAEVIGFFFFMIRSLF
ncbi:MAG: hemolysin [Bacteriophage sp.]|nr:MAG: hemolysin [Bacteriophage sp.]